MTLGHAPNEPKGRQGRRCNVTIARGPVLRRVVTAAVLLLGISVPFGVIGHFAAAQGQVFNWDSASLAATALATVLLASYTAVLATSTAKDVKATRSLARLAKRDQEQRDRATLIVTGVAY
jgi:Ca2+/H+ antiporter